MSTFDQLTDSTLLYLYGYTTLQDQASYLSASISASATSIAVADATAMSRGVVEIGDELLWIDSVDTTALTITAPPYGRGFRGTTAATHASGVRVAVSPLFPRALVKGAINETIQAVYPDLMGVASTTITWNPAVSTYALPAGARNVLSVSAQTVGPSLEWVPVRSYRVDPTADTSAFASGASITITAGITPGRTVKIMYTKQPTVLSAASDDFVTVTGLPASCEDVIRLGAAYRMVPFFDAPHLSGASAEADFGQQQSRPGSAAALGRYLLQLFSVRKDEEAKRLQAMYPIRMHFSR